MPDRELKDNLDLLLGDGVREEEEASYNAAERRLALQLQKEELDGKSQDRVQRKEYANRIYCLLCCYLACVFLLVLLSGFCCIQFALSENVLLMLLGTTTANVIALFAIVPKYLFSK